MAKNRRQELIDHWNAYAEQHLVGRQIVAASYMDPEEIQASLWPAAALVIQLDDGTTFYPMADDEGNGPGALAGVAPQGLNLLFPVV